MVIFGNSVQTVPQYDRRPLIVTSEELKYMKPIDHGIDYNNKELWDRSYEDLVFVMQEDENYRRLLLEEILNRDYTLNMTGVIESEMDFDPTMYGLEKVDLNTLSDIEGVKLLEDEKTKLGKILDNKKYTMAGLFIVYVVG